MARVTIHYMVEDPAGPISSRRVDARQGDRSVTVSRGGRYKVACQPDRKYLARVTPDGKRVLEYFSATDDVGVVTCPLCLGTAAYQQKTGGQ